MLEGFTTVDQVIQNVTSVDETKHPDIEFEYQDRTPSLITRAKRGIRGSTLKNGMDYVQLYLYLIEFWGYGEQARTNTVFLNKMMTTNLPKRRKSYYEKVVLLKLAFISENHETFKNAIRSVHRVSMSIGEILLSNMIQLKIKRWRHTFHPDMLEFRH